MPQTLKASQQSLPPPHKDEGTLLLWEELRRMPTFGIEMGSCTVLRLQDPKWVP